MIARGDPVATGLVASLARPGRDVSGLTYYATDLVEKRRPLLEGMVPGATRIAVLEDVTSARYGQDAERAARALGLGS
jgi:putative ABC transport system substrate-binding protein